MRARNVTRFFRKSGAGRAQSTYRGRTVARGSTDQIHRRFVERLRAAAKARRLQLTHVPDLAGVSRSHFWDVLAGRKSPTLWWVGEVAGALRCEPAELLSGGSLATVPPGPARGGRHLPLMSMRAAAAAGGLPATGEIEPARWVVATTRRTLRPGMFAAAVSGRAMEPLIRSGSIGLFRLLEGRDPDGKVVMVHLRGLRDPETGGRYLIRHYRALARRDGQVCRAVLEPDNRKHQALVLDERSIGRATPFAELLEVLVPASR